ncbi:MAG: ROK family transcriptional regulator [bacterium]|nr:ROK family transcriptional regulator [bacterium]
MDLSMVIGSKELIRDINNNLVLETIIHKSPISRASLSKELGLTKATISTIVQDLIDRKLIIEIGSDNTELGRKPILLTFNKQAGLALCIDIQLDSCTAVLSDLQAETLNSDTFDSPKDPNDLPDVLCSYVRNIMYNLPNTVYGLVGITLSIHGVTYEKTIKFVPYYNLAGIDLCKQLEDHFHIPVYIENEANLSAIGENSFVYDHADLASVSVHTGIGLGLIMGNRLVKGYRGYTGEVGHTIVNIDGRPCPCGNHGCLEQYVSQKVLMQEFAEKKGLDYVTFDDFLSYYRADDPDAKAIIDTFIKYMSVGLNNILNSFNPEIVVINSNFTSKLPELTDYIIDGLSSKMNNFGSVKASSLEGKASMLGGLCVAIRNFLGITFLRLQRVSNAHVKSDTTS